MIDMRTNKNGSLAGLYRPSCTPRRSFLPHMSAVLAPPFRQKFCAAQSWLRAIIARSPDTPSLIKHNKAAIKTQAPVLWLEGQYQQQETRAVIMQQDQAAILVRLVAHKTGLAGPTILDLPKKQKALANNRPRYA